MKKRLEIMTSQLVEFNVKNTAEFYRIRDELVSPFVTVDTLFKAFGIKSTVLRRRTTTVVLSSDPRVQQHYQETVVSKRKAKRKK